MREIDMLRDLPQATDRPAIKRTIQNKIVASYRDERFFDGDRADGYGGLVDDGRWKPVAAHFADIYGLGNTSKVLQLDCEKAFLAEEFAQLGMQVYTTESSTYARSLSTKKKILWTNRIDHFRDTEITLTIAIGAIYTRSLPDAIALIKDIERVSLESFITLGSFDAPEDERIFREWSLLGCTILSKPDWLEVLKHCGYTGDYKFVTARTLGLV